MRRREFCVAAVAGLPISAQETPAGIMTVDGLILQASAGFCLPHEHLFSQFGEPPAEPGEYDREALLAAVVPYAKKVRDLGVRTIFDCTAAYFGRSPLLLREIAKQTQLTIVTNTGYYGAADDKYVPAHAFSETADQLAGRWTAEWKNGIGDTGIRPGFIKTAVDAGPLTAIDRKLVTAAARTHRQTGLTMAVHTGNNPGAVEQQLAILRKEGVSPGAWIWTHANQVKDQEALAMAAKAGGWISLDGVDAESVNRHEELLRFLKSRGFLRQVLLSHDGNSNRPGGRPMRSYETLMTGLIPKLKSSGFSGAEIEHLTVRNPANAFAVRIRLVRGR